MAKKKTTIKLSNAEKKRRSRQASINFGHTKKTVRKVNKVAKKKQTVKANPLMGIARNIVPAVGVGLANPFVDTLAKRYAPTLPKNLVKGGIGVGLQLLTTGIPRKIGSTMTAIAISDMTQAVMQGQNPFSSVAVVTNAPVPQVNTDLILA